MLVPKTNFKINFCHTFLFTGEMFFLSTDHWFKLVNFSRLQKLAKEAVVYMELKLKLSDDSNSESNEIFQFHIFRAVNYPISDRIN